MHFNRFLLLVPLLTVGAGLLTIRNASTAVPIERVELQKFEHVGLQPPDHNQVQVQLQQPSGQFWYGGYWGYRPGYTYSNFRYSNYRYATYRYVNYRYQGYRYSDFRFNTYRYGSYRYAGYRYGTYRYSLWSSTSTERGNE